MEDQSKKIGMIAAGNKAALAAGLLASDARRAARDEMKKSVTVPRGKKTTNGPNSRTIASLTECERPPAGSNKEDLRELHREKMRNKKARRKAGR